MFVEGLACNYPQECPDDTVIYRCNTRGIHTGLATRREMELTCVCFYYKLAHTPLLAKPARANVFQIGPLLPTGLDLI